MFRLGDVPSAAALRRPCWRKQAYESQGAAEAHLRSLERSPRVRSPADRLRVYACRHCTHWHVGHAR